MASEMRAPKVKLGLKLVGIYLAVALLTSVAATIAAFTEDDLVATVAGWIQAVVSPLSLIGAGLIATAPSASRAVVPAVIGALCALGIVASSWGGMFLDPDSYRTRGLVLIVALAGGLAGFGLLVSMTKAAQNLAWAYAVRDTHDRLATLFISTMVLLVAGFVLRCITRAMPEAAVIGLILPFFGAVISAFVAFNLLQLSKRLPDYF
jgi:hypothetical protein